LFHHFGTAGRGQVNIIDLACNLKRYTLVWWPFNFLAAAHRQIGILVEPADTFVIHPRKLGAQQIINASVAEPAAYVCNVHNALTQITRELIGLCIVKLKAEFTDLS
jgi:hypothetical protein